MASFDVVIVGAGIVGSACARAFSAAGLSVAICEAHEYCGGGATAAGMGHVAVMDDSEPQYQLTSYSQRLWQQLAQELPASAEYLNCGSLWIAADDEEMTEVRRKFDFYTARRTPVEILDEKQLAEAEPNLRPGMAGALLMSDDSVCYPPCVAAYLAEQAAQAGCVAKRASQVVRVEDGWVQLSDGETLSGRWIVVAAGVASRNLLPEIDMQPKKGHLIISDRYPGFVRHQLIELGYLKSAHVSKGDSVAFNVQPRATGQLLLGSSRQFDKEESAIDHKMLTRMLERAVEYMPELRNLQFIRSWTGFRAATPDKLPLIGPAGEYGRVLLATGHEGLGISTSLATAELLLDHMLQRPSTIPMVPYLPSRTFVAHA